ncbi:MAG: hypothetical protein APR54_07740 [Candidatus Cloacimonas sp. SDB]|nr:MAG: hypothetical protein APR54_07740 [Candidatus Cloacimonas sp. SDB]
MNKFKYFYQYFPKTIFLILLVNNCICRDKWITVEGHFFYVNNSENITQSLIYYGKENLPDSVDITPLAGAYFALNLDIEQAFEFDSMLIRNRSDSSGYLRISSAAPPGKYKILIYAGKEGFYPAEIVAVDPPDNEDQIHHINILLVPLKY